jgi:hypothetical protein
MKVKVTVLITIFTLIVTTSLLFKSLFTSEEYSYEKYDPTLIAFKNLKHDYV